MLDHVADVVFFGAIVPCKEQKCKGGNFEFDGNSTYRCKGKLSGFGDCNNKIKEPERRPVILPSEISEAYPFLNREFKAENRIIKENPKRTKAKRTLKPRQVPLSIKQKPQFKEMFVKGIYVNSHLHLKREFFLNLSFCLFGLDRGIVEPGSGLQNTAHVYILDKKPYSVALNKVELSVHKDQNAYYKLQILESDADPKRQVN